jgi:hypothetical protein
LFQLDLSGAAASQRVAALANDTWLWSGAKPVEFGLLYSALGCV